MSGPQRVVIPKGAITPDRTTVVEIPHKLANLPIVVVGDGDGKSKSREGCNSPCSSKPGSKRKDKTPGDGKDESRTMMVKKKTVLENAKDCSDDSPGVLPNKYPKSSLPKATSKLSPPDQTDSREAGPSGYTSSRQLREKLSSPCPPCPPSKGSGHHGDSRRSDSSHKHKTHHTHQSKSSEFELQCGGIKIKASIGNVSGKSESSRGPSPSSSSHKSKASGNAEKIISQVEQQELQTFKSNLDNLQDKRVKLVLNAFYVMNAGDLAAVLLEHFHEKLKKI